MRFFNIAAKLLIKASAALLVLAIMAATAFAAGHLKNKTILSGLMKDFTHTIAEYADADIIETKSVHGKLNGNGNGIQYFGCALIRADSIDDIDSLIDRLDERFEAVEYFAQDGRDISSYYIEHRVLKYNAPPDANKDYISIVFFNSHHQSSAEFDLDGH